MTATMAAIERLGRALRPVLGEAGVVTDADAIERYTVDFWRQHRGRTSLVLRPSTTDDVVAVVRAAGEHGVGLVPQSGNTGLVAGGIPDDSGSLAVVSLERMDRIRKVDAVGGHLVAEAGCILADVQAAADEAGRLFPLSLGAEGSCRIGGNLSTNAGGVNVLRYGMTRQLVMGLEVVLADGRVWHGLKALPKDNTGYDLKQLFIGAEGSLGIVTAAALKLFPRPRERRTIWLGIESPETALALLALFQERLGELISSFELIAGFGVEAAHEHLPGGRRPLAEPHDWHLLIEVAWSLAEGLDGPVERTLEAAFEAGLVADGTIAQNEAQRQAMWRIREGQSEATSQLGYVLRSDISVAVADLPALIARATPHFAKLAPDVTLFPFGHVGDGNLHFNFLIPRDEARIAELKPLLTAELAELVAAFGGSFSAEHGIGRLKRPELERYKDPLALELMQRLKAALDPQGILNPGVILKAPLHPRSHGDH
jgi:FAD/FMN-containing dehydrogenase